MSWLWEKYVHFKALILGAYNSPTIAERNKIYVENHSRRQFCISAEQWYMDLSSLS